MRSKLNRRIMGSRAGRSALMGACAVLSISSSAFAALSGTVDMFVGASYAGSGTGSNWFDGSNWSTGQPPVVTYLSGTSGPTIGDLVLIDNGGLVENDDPAATLSADTIFLGSSAGASGGILISAGTLSVIGTNPSPLPAGEIGSNGLRVGSNNSYLTGTPTGGIGTVDQTGGFVTTALAVNIGIGGNGTYTISGGTLSVPTNVIAIGNGERNTAISGSTGVSGSGTLIMNGGDITAEGLSVGRYNSTPGYSGNGTFDITGGSITLGTISIGGNGGESIPNNQNPQGTMTVSGTAGNPVSITINGNTNIGQGDATANSVAGTLTIGSNVTYTQTGNTVMAIGNGSMSRGMFTNNGGEVDIASGTFQLGRNGSIATYTQNSGTLNVQTFSVTGVSASNVSTLQILGGTANFNGGTLGSSGILELGVPMTLSQTIAYGNGTYQIDANNTATLSGSQNFGSAHTFGKSGAGTLIIGGAFNYGSGIAGGITVANGTLRMQSNGGSSLTINANGGSTSLETQETISKLAIGAGGAVGLNAASQTTHGVTTFSIAGNTVPTGKLDIGNNNLVINYTAGNSPIANVQAQVISGYNHGAWNGEGIVSSAAATASAHPMGVGYGEASAVSFAGSLGGVPVDGDTLIVRYTYLGDADMNGVVDSNDFGRLAADYGSTTNNGWESGDFNYDGTVNALDFNALATNFGQGPISSEPIGAMPAESLGAAVPEPVSGVMLGVVGMGMMMRRRRAE